MKNILQQLFDGEIYPYENLCVNAPEYKRISGALRKEKEQFEATLSDGGCEQFERIAGLYLELASLFSYEGFASGYRLGIMLLFEALKGEEDTNRNGK